MSANRTTWARVMSHMVIIYSKQLNHVSVNRPTWARALLHIINLNLKNEGITCSTLNTTGEKRINTTRSTLRGSNAHTSAIREESKQVLQAARHVPAIQATWARVPKHAVMKTCKLHASAIIVVLVCTEHCGPPMRFPAHADIWRGVRQNSHHRHRNTASTHTVMMENITAAHITCPIPWMLARNTSPVPYQGLCR